MTYLNSMVADHLQVPEHLLSCPWFELETAQAARVFRDMEKLVGKLDKKLNERRVHDARVALRRWNSVWDILCVDGWENIDDGGDFEQKIGRKLKKLNRYLGQLRDLDVSLALARDLHINRFVVKHLAAERKKLAGKIGKKIGKIKVGRLIRRLGSYLDQQSRQLPYKTNIRVAGKNGNNGHSPDPEAAAREDSAYFHLNQFLQQSEHHCRLLLEPGQNNDELHELRLSIKRWRYLLTEFFGLTNLQLVTAQQILGRIRDLNRLKEEIEGRKSAVARALAKGILDEADLQAEQELIAAKLAEQFRLLEPVLEDLPFGLRPYCLSR